MKGFYPLIEPYQHSLLDVGEGHQLYIEQCGNPKGQPVVFIHGGPGGGSSNNDRRFFDPKRYRIIVYDQRGCGRSVPHGCLENNDSTRLIEDLNRIRKHLSIDRWRVFGGSWGSTLALIYAQGVPTTGHQYGASRYFFGPHRRCTVAVRMWRCKSTFPRLLSTVFAGTSAIHT